MINPMGIDMKVLEQVSDELQAYVYMLVDPESAIPFYVGKGHRLRHAMHLAEALIPIEESSEEASHKHAKIKEILARGSGIEPDVWIVRYGLRSVEYTAAEAALIDLLMTFPIAPRLTGEARLPLGQQGQLTNARRENARGHGIMLLQTLVDDYAAPPLATREPLLLITLNGSEDIPAGEEMADGHFRYWAGWDNDWLVSSVREKSFQQIGESASGWWNIDLDRVARWKIKHAAVEHRGVTRALLRIDPASWMVRINDHRKAFCFQVIDSGPLFGEVVGPHGHRLPAKVRGDRGSVHYWPRL
jgi:hypothetical protein